MSLMISPSTMGITTAAMIKASRIVTVITDNLQNVNQQ